MPELAVVERWKFSQEMILHFPFCTDIVNLIDVLPFYTEYYFCSITNFQQFNRNIFLLTILQMSLSKSDNKCH